MSNLSLEQYELPVTPTALGEIGSILRSHDVFSCFDSSVDCYDVLTFRRQQLRHNSKVCALFDRNILNDVLSLFRNNPSAEFPSCSDRGRIGAAVMAFLQAGNVLIEPCIALYENPKLATQELDLFRRADNVDTAIYAKLALGVLNKAPSGCLPSNKAQPPQVDYFKPLTGRRIHRVAVLKIAVLDLSSDLPHRKLRRYMEWCHRDFLFCAPAMLLAIIHLTSRCASPLIKNLRSQDRNKAVQDIDNAVWDLLLIRKWLDFVDEQKRENKLWLLCSRDKTLKTIATALHVTEPTTEKLEAGLTKLFKAHWGSERGEALARLGISLQRDAANPVRKLNQPESHGLLDQLESELERQILDWRPC